MKIMMALAGLDIGGAETHVLELSKKMRMLGHEVVMVSGGGVYQDEAEEFGIKHYTVPVKERNYLNIIKAYGMIKEIIIKEKPDLVHSHARIPSFIIGMIHRLMNKSFVYVTTVHGAFDTSFLLRNLTHWGEKTLAVSEDLKQYLVKNYHIPKNNIYISINGIDNTKFNEAISGESVLKEFGLNHNARRIVYVSRLEDNVCAPVYAILENMAYLDSVIAGIEFVIVGEGKSSSKIKSLADKVNKSLSRRAVILTGQRTDVNKIHATADVCVGVSRAILEPMAMKKACIIAGQEGYIGILGQNNLKDAIDCNFTCRGCDKLDSKRLSDDIIKILTMSESEYFSVASFGNDIVNKHYSIDKMAEDNAKMYYDAIRDHKHNAVMVGYYGYGNRGDDALLYAIINDMRKVCPSFSPVVLSRNPKNTTESYGVKSINRFNIIKVNRAMKSARLFLAGGGSLIQDVTSTRSLLYYLYCLKAAKKHGLKVMLYANGIGPVNKESNRKKAAKVLSDIDVITLRDTDSKEYLNKFNVKSPDVYVTADPAFGLDTFDSEGAEKILSSKNINGRFAAISVRNISNGNDAFVSQFAKMADYITDKYNLACVFIPMQHSKDKKISLDIIANMKNKAYFIDNDISIAQIMGIISLSEAVIAVRLHMLLFGVAMGVPVLGINYDPKVKSNISEIGVGDCLEPYEITDGSFMSKVDLFFDSLEENRAVLPKKLEAYKKKALENADIASKLLENN